MTQQYGSTFRNFLIKGPVKYLTTLSYASTREFPTLSIKPKKVPLLGYRGFSTKRSKLLYFRQNNKVVTLTILHTPLAILTHGFKLISNHIPTKGTLTYPSSTL